VRVLNRQGSRWQCPLKWSIEAREKEKEAEGRIEAETKGLSWRLPRSRVGFHSSRALRVEKP
jgi:hypothetical protein